MTHPPTATYNNLKKKKKKKLHLTRDRRHVTCDTRHVTCDMWHMTRDMWHVTRDMWHVTRDTLGGMNILSQFQLPSSYWFWFMLLWRYGGKGSLTHWISDEAVYRTAPATPGLLNTAGWRKNTVDWSKMQRRYFVGFWSDNNGLLGGITEQSSATGG